ncbi:hypothetical protein DND132_0108 [Pseudodesulfovibrio mercurii]|uniref:Uncharacterized protein n=1 Tax=Pseudodesulfovibrio mercurii TaxID=641491 RepID=F0JDF7_9BACT|nr:hypothetical protein DND132_0108 [Pseudodesulfovibrio mercurii]
MGKTLMLIAAVAAGAGVGFLIYRKFRSRCLP